MTSGHFRSLAKKKTSWSPSRTKPSHCGFRTTSTSCGLRVITLNLLQSATLGASAAHRHSNSRMGTIGSRSAECSGRPGEPGSCRRRMGRRTKRCVRHRSPSPTGSIRGIHFENFVVGSNNQLAHAAASPSAQAPGKAYNPLFLYGGTASGRPTLMHAIGCRDPGTKTQPRQGALSFQGKIHERVHRGVSGGNLTKFPERYRQADVLLIDDIQFLAGKEHLQEEFFHTFNALFSGENRSCFRVSAALRDSDAGGAAGFRFEWGCRRKSRRPTWKRGWRFFAGKRGYGSADPRVLDFMRSASEEHSAAGRRT